MDGHGVQLGGVEDWVRFIFDRPATDEPYEVYCQHDAMDDWPAASYPAEAVAYLTQTCLDGARLLGGYSDAQIAAGFGYLLGAWASDYQEALLDDAVSLEAGEGCLRAMPALFAGVFDVRLRGTGRSAVERPGLASTVLRWWIPLAGVDGMAHHRGSSRREPLAMAAIAAQERILSVSKSEICAASALWGLRQWGMWGARRQVAEPVIMRFMAQRDRLAKSLRPLAEACLDGPVQT